MIEKVAEIQKKLSVNVSELSATLQHSRQYNVIKSNADTFIKLKKFGTCSN
ncbi:hypothetical protein ACF0H5_016223 [Mactra antiquata]